MSTALNDTINFQRRLRALSALFLYRLTSLAVSIGYFQRRKLVIVYWHFSRLKQRFQKRKRSTLIFSSFKNRNKLRFDGFFLFIYLFITLHNRVSVWPKIKNNEYISISGKWKLNEIGTKIFFFFLTFILQEIRDSEAENFFWNMYKQFLILRSKRVERFERTCLQKWGISETRLSDLSPFNAFLLFVYFVIFVF